MDAALSGWRPQLDACVACGRMLSPQEPVFLDVEGGGLRCKACVTAQTPALPLTAGQAAWLRDVMRNGIEKTACPPRNAPFTPLLRYLEARLDVRIHSAKSLL